ncbi:unnamed protein product [Ilex paraguariensis]|uniref:Uncharacterized protein n=1 Tax=Ilex paraguariensis TaxID=185542 RepID=A0ABC8SMS8_9AQUA
MVTIEKSLTVPEHYDGCNERTTFEHSVSVPVTDVRCKVRTTGVSDAQNCYVGFDKRLSKVEVALSEFRADHDALSAKYTVEVNEIKQILQTLSEKVVDALIPHITDVSDEVRNAILNYIFHEALDATETIVQFDSFHATRLTMQSLAPTQFLPSEMRHMIFPFCVYPLKEYMGVD